MRLDEKDSSPLPSKEVHVEALLILKRIFRIAYIVSIRHFEGVRVLPSSTSCPWLPVCPPAKNDVKIPDKSDVWQKIVRLERPKPIRSLSVNKIRFLLTGSEGHASSAKPHEHINNTHGKSFKPIH